MAQLENPKADQGLREKGASTRADMRTVCKTREDNNSACRAFPPLLKRAPTQALPAAGERADERRLV
jgi:hypothetical protein